MKHRFYILTVLALVLLGLSACGINTKIKRADKKFAIGEYYDAADIYKSVYTRISPKKDKPLKARIAFNQGECYRILNHSRAASAYQNAVRYRYPDDIVYLRLAQVQQYQGKYKDAEKNYTLYLQAHPDDYVAQGGLYACRQIAEWKKQPSRYKVSLAKEFNQQRTSNFAPAYIGSDADAVMFTSNRQISKTKKIKRNSPVTGAQTFNLFSSRMDANGKWLDIALAEGLYNGEDDNSQAGDSTDTDKTGTMETGVCSFTADGKTMYFTYSLPVNGQDLGTKIYRSDRAGGEWGEAREIKLFTDSSITVGHPAINATGDTLYFASDAPNGYGGKDIWMAELEGDTWINAQNLGPQVNTSGDELFPCIRADGTLYFSSNGHPGYGGLDIFKAVPQNKTDSNGLMLWDLFNMAAPFNSNGDDFGITFAGNTENGFFSSNRGQKKGIDQIYSFYLPEMIFLVEGTVTDPQGEPISDGTLRLVGDNGTNQKIQIRHDGTYRLKVQKDAHYVMLASSRGYLNQKNEFNTLNLNDSRTYTLNFVLPLISKPVTMENIFYEFGKWDLTPESESGLQQLVKLLNDNPNITIELSAHTDLVGDDKSNAVLSEKRAQSVVNYLIKAGIEQERLTPVGYGEIKPVVTDKALHGKYPFLPQDQVLDEAFILSLPKDQQDICNQINRRTEFRVLKTTYKLY